MTLKEELKDKIPNREHTRDYKLLLELVEKRNLKTAEQLDAYLHKREEELHTQLQQAKDIPTKNDLRRHTAEELEMIKNCKDYLRYL